jgi:hypothetical protein
MSDPLAQLGAACIANCLSLQGPWFAASAKPSPTWSEDAPDENWLFISWDMMNPKAHNAARFWDGGGATFAHEVDCY